TKQVGSMVLGATCAKLTKHVGLVAKSKDRGSNSIGSRLKRMEDKVGFFLISLYNYQFVSKMTPKMHKMMTRILIFCVVGLILLSFSIFLFLPMPIYFRFSLTAGPNKYLT
uniref:Uncharacterized protein n=1 Tax=Gouania willdenowi TaxID=441366 RepID=A0A8C5FYG4_GOUWI